MKTSKIFRAAKAQLWDGEGHWLARKKDRFVCYAILEHPNISNRDKYRARHIVESLLGRHETLEDWLSAKHRIHAYEDLCKMQETRQAWLDHLIAHYESLGD
jgi:hypothetical protein